MLKHKFWCLCLLKPDNVFVNPPPNTRGEKHVNNLVSSSAGDVVDIYQREFLALRERLHSAEQENLRRSKELNLVLEEIKRAIAEKQALRDINRTWSSLSGQCFLFNRDSPGPTSYHLLQSVCFNLTRQDFGGLFCDCCGSFSKK